MIANEANAAVGGQDMDVKTNTTYDPKTVKLLTFYDAVPAFLEGTDTPRDYLERCIETIEARDSEVKAFVTINIDGARAAADASTERYRAGKPLSPVDGMPIAIKDLYLTEDMPTQMGSPIYKGYQAPRDCAAVHALRKSGAIILGKVVTTEFGFYHPGPATNPFDSTRTPGGSSSGSGACVGARMVPVAIGSQAASSLLRPASFCANVGFKPSYGALNRAGGHSVLSHAVIGPQAGSLEDAWAVAHQIASTVGGDAGQPGLYGEQALPAPEKPQRLARLNTPGWEVSDEAVRGKLEAAVAELASHNIAIVSKDDDPKVAALETELEDCYEVCMDITAGPCSGATPCARRCVTLASVGAAPVGIASTASPIYGVPISVLGAPALSLPLLEIEGMPLGLQLMGFRHEDARIIGIGNWIMRTASRRVRRRKVWGTSCAGRSRSTARRLPIS